MKTTNFMNRDYFVICSEILNQLTIFESYILGDVCLW